MDKFSEKPSGRILTTSRQNLLEYIQEHQAVTASELARALRMTNANARHHLSSLVREGVLEVVGEQPARGRGRPSALYSLSTGIRGDNLGVIAHHLLKRMLSSLTPEEQSFALKELAGQLAGNPVSPENDSSRKTLTQRLYKAVLRLNELQYKARWEAHSGGPRVILAYCPYARILDQHPELCSLDRFMIEGLLDSDVTQIARRAPDRRGERTCVFEVRRSGGS
jgi:predicted ArsR family transcriptional regulator